MLAILLSLSFSLGVLAQGNTSCSTSNLDWYSDAVGETPCQTYQRVRRICNPDFTVGSLNPSLPPDTCNDQVGDCCCSSVTFALSMLCLNCQQGARGAGIDAPTGTYQKYLQKGGGTQCGPVTNQSFTNDIQTGVCNEGIKVENGLYGLFWVDGSWFYQYTHDSLSKDAAVNPSGLFSHCSSTSSSSSSSSTSMTPSTSPTQDSNTNNPPQPTPTQNPSSSSPTSGTGSGGGSTPNSSSGIPSSSSGSPTTDTGTTNPNPNPSSHASQFPNSGASSSTSSGVPTNGTDIPSSIDSSSRSGSSGLGTGGIVGISVGIFVLLLLLVIGLVYTIRMRRRQQRQGGNEKGGVLGFVGGGDSGGAGGAGMSESSSEVLVSRGQTNNSTHLNSPASQGIPTPTNRILADASIRKDRDGLGLGSGRDSYNYTRNSDSLAISHENENHLYELGGGPEIGIQTGIGAESGYVWSQPSAYTTTTTMIRPTSPTTDFSLSPSHSASQVGAHNLHNSNNRVTLPVPVPASSTPNHHNQLTQSRGPRFGTGHQLLPLSESETAITGTETTSYASEYYTTTNTRSGTGTGTSSVSAPEFEEPPPSYYHGHVSRGHTNLNLGRDLGVVNRGSGNE